MIQTGFESRVKIQDIISNQLPNYILDESPLTSDFLKQYYISQEYQSGPIDLIENIDQYIKISELTNLTDSVILDTALTFNAEEVTVDLIKSPNGTKGFPETYGLLKIDAEIITYTGKQTQSLQGV